MQRSLNKYTSSFSLYWNIFNHCISFFQSCSQALLNWNHIYCAMIFVLSWLRRITHPDDSSPSDLSIRFVVKHTIVSPNAYLRWREIFHYLEIISKDSRIFFWTETISPRTERVVCCVEVDSRIASCIYYNSRLVLLIPVRRFSSVSKIRLLMLRRRSTLSVTVTDRWSIDCIDDWSFLPFPLISAHVIDCGRFVTQLRRIANTVWRTTAPECE